jgi:hypothetical protein
MFSSFIHDTLARNSSNLNAFCVQVLVVKTEQEFIDVLRSTDQAAQSVRLRSRRAGALSRSSCAQWLKVAFFFCAQLVLQITVDSSGLTRLLSAKFCDLAAKFPVKLFVRIDGKLPSKHPEFEWINLVREILTGSEANFYETDTTFAVIHTKKWSHEISSSQFLEGVAVRLSIALLTRCSAGVLEAYISQIARSAAKERETAAPVAKS